MKILAVNTRMTGGAFNVVKTLKSEMESNGHEYLIAYGYGQRGKKDLLEEEYDAVQLSGQFTVLSNYLSHSIFGAEYFSPNSILSKRFLNSIKNSDVIHLNVIHSYLAPFKWMVGLLISAGKPIVWTHHDSWAITGRCAITHNCKMYSEGCSKCLHKNFYPPTFIDFAQSGFIQKRKLIDELNKKSRIIHVAPSEWLANLISAEIEVDCHTIYNSVSSNFFNSSETHVVNDRIIFSARDLQDEVKTNQNDLAKVAKKLGSQLTIVGDFPSREIVQSGAILLPYQGNLDAYIKLLKEHQALLLLSRFESFSLTAIEARVAGLQVYAAQSLASNELKSKVGLTIFEDAEKIDFTSAHVQKEDYDLDFFLPKRMADEYLAVFKEVLK